MKRKNIRPKLIAAALCMSLLVQSFSITALAEETTEETAKKHEAITFRAPYLDVDSFIEEVHKTYPEVHLEVVPYSGANTTTYLQNMLEENDLPEATI